MYTKSILVCHTCKAGFELDGILNFTENDAIKEGWWHSPRTSKWFCSLCRPSSSTKPDLSKDAPVEVNEAGGRSSDTGCNLTYVPLAMLALGGVFAYGAKKYEPNNWKKLPIEDHINHVLVHLQAHLFGDTQDDHLSHAACRMMMALELWEEAANVPAFIIDPSKLDPDTVNAMLNSRVGEIIRMPPGAKPRDIPGLVAEYAQGPRGPHFEKQQEETAKDPEPETKIHPKHSPHSVGPLLCCSQCHKLDFLHGDTLKIVRIQSATQSELHHVWLCRNCYTNFNPEKQDNS